jgi:hypothetical protein
MGDELNRLDFERMQETLSLYFHEADKWKDRAERAEAALAADHKQWLKLLQEKDAAMAEARALLVDWHLAEPSHHEKLLAKTRAFLAGEKPGAASAPSQWPMECQRCGDTFQGAHECAPEPPAPDGTNRDQATSTTAPEQKSSKDSKGLGHKSD